MSPASSHAGSWEPSEVVKNSQHFFSNARTALPGLPSIAAIIAVITLVAVVAVVAVIAVMPANLADRHGHVTHLSWPVTITVIRIGAWGVMHHPLRLAGIMAMAVVMRVIQRRDQQRADGNAGDHRDDCASLESGSTAGRHQASGQQYNLGNSTDHKYLRVSKGDVFPYAHQTTGARQLRSAVSKPLVKIA